VAIRSAVGSDLKAAERLLEQKLAESAGSACTMIRRTPPSACSRIATSHMPSGESRRAHTRGSRGAATGKPIDGGNMLKWWKLES
jgi:hypothetical protein